VRGDGMKAFSGKFREAMVTVFIVILLILASPFILVWLIFATITDYIKYKQTQYYKDTGEKYSWLCCHSSCISFYNDITNAHLPIEYYRDKGIKITGYGYFIYKDTLLLCDYDSDFFFDKETDEWVIYDEHDYILLETAVDDYIKKVNDFLGRKVCNKAIIFTESELLEDAPENKYERIEFLPMTDGDKFSALKNRINL
jgi:hypothetical protein